MIYTYLDYKDAEMPIGVDQQTAVIDLNNVFIYTFMYNGEVSAIKLSLSST